MEQSLMKDIMLVVGPLVGVIIGGLLAWLNSRSQIKRQELRERKRLILDKLEELHQLLTGFIEYYGSLTFKALRRQGTMERVISPEIEPVPFDRIKLLIGFYAPELSVHTENIDRIAKEYAVPFTKLLVNEESSDDENSRAIVSRCKNELIEECQQMQDEIIELSKKYF